MNKRKDKQETYMRVPLMVSQGQIDRIADAISRIPATNPSYIAVGQETLGDVLSQGMIRKIAQVATKIETRAMIGYASENDVMADEIKRLQAEIERLRAYAHHERSLGAEGPMIELTQARQEIERLRAVIEQNAGIYQADMRRLRAQRNDWRKRAFEAMPSAEP